MVLGLPYILYYFQEFKQQRKEKEKGCGRARKHHPTTKAGGLLSFQSPLYFTVSFLSLSKEL
jgi:hypothetical protein